MFDALNSAFILFKYLHCNNSNIIFINSKKKESGKHIRDISNGQDLNCAQMKEEKSTYRYSSVWNVSL